MAQSAAPNNPFIKQLAANDRQTRDRAVSSLRTYLSRATPFTPIEHLKLWKGLFYCMWSQDKPKPQQRLAMDLAELVSLLSTPTNFIGFMRAFWQTMSREYPGIDNLRMDKFLFLIRQYVNAGFAYCARGDWKDEDTRKEYLDVLREVPLNPRDPKVPNGLRYHVADVYVDELEKVDAELAPYDEMLAPLRELAADSPLKSVRVRVGEALDDDRVKAWSGEPVDSDEDGDEDGEDADNQDEEEGDDDDEFGGFDD